METQGPKPHAPGAPADPADSAGAATAEPDPLVGTVVAGRYRIERKLGAGGMGAVYLAEQAPLGRKVALKVMLATLTSDPTAAARFQQEATSISRLNHPNIVTVHDFGRTDDGLCFMALEFVEGRLLRDLLDPATGGGALPYASALHVVTGICRAMVEAHRMGIVHRDLKPENVMIVESAHDEPLVKVLDFGLAKIVAGDKMTSSGTPSAQKPITQKPALTEQKVIMGTPQYMAPEQIHGLPVDARTDLYALGILFWELIAGYPPFTDESPVAVLVKHLHHALPALVKVAPHTPLAADAFITQLCAKDPAQRPDSAATALARFRGLATTDPWSSVVSSPGVASLPAMLAAQKAAQSAPQPSAPTLRGDDDPFAGLRTSMAPAQQQPETKRMVAPATTEPMLRPPPSPQTPASQLPSPPHSSQTPASQLPSPPHSSPFATQPDPSAGGYVAADGTFVRAPRESSSPGTTSPPLAPSSSAPTKLAVDRAAVRPSLSPIARPSTSSSAPMGSRLRTLLIVAGIGVAAAVALEWGPSLVDQLGGDVGGTIASVVDTDGFDDAAFAEKTARFKRTIEGAPLSASAYVAKGTALMEQGAHAEADVELRKAIAVAPADVAAVSAWVENAAELHDVVAQASDGALLKMAATGVGVRAPDDPASLRARGALAFALGNVVEARRLLNEALARTTTDDRVARTRLLLARALLANAPGDVDEKQIARAQRIDAAVAHVKAVSAPTDAHAYALLLANALVRAGQPAEAERVLVARLGAAANDVDAALTLARLRIDLGLEADAVRVLEEARADSPQNEELAVMTALALHRVGRTKSAVALLTSLTPPSARTNVLAAQALLALPGDGATTKANAKRAAALAQAAMESTPGSAQDDALSAGARYALGEARRRLSTAGAVDTLVRAGDGTGPAAAVARLLAAQHLPTSDRSLAASLLEPLAARPEPDARAAVLLMLADLQAGQGDAALARLQSIATVGLDERLGLANAPVEEAIIDEAAQWRAILDRVARWQPSDGEAVAYAAVRTAAAHFAGVPLARDEGAKSAKPAKGAKKASSPPPEVFAHPALALWRAVDELAAGAPAKAQQAIDQVPSDAKLDPVMIDIVRARIERALNKLDPAEGRLSLHDDPRAVGVRGDILARTAPDRARPFLREAWMRDPRATGALRALYRLP